MPSLRHENLIQLFRDCPDLVPVFLRRAGAAIPARTRARVVAESFSDLQRPVSHPDAVIALENPGGKLLRLAAVDVQLACDEDKRFSWPLYVAAQRARLRVPVYLVVVAPDAEVARWCQEPIPLDIVGNVYRPLVLGPEVIPRVVELEEAQAFPALAVLSAAVHGQEQDAAVIALAALVGCSTLDRDRATRYADLIMASLSEAAREALEALMQEHKVPYESEFARKYFDQGHDQGLQQGLEAGALTERRRMLCKLLDRRFGAVPAHVLARVEAAEADALARWLDRLLDEPPSLDAVLDG